MSKSATLRRCTGQAGHQKTALFTRKKAVSLERKTGFEPATFCMASRKQAHFDD
jgi:hypothetical protein